MKKDLLQTIEENAVRAGSLQTGVVEYNIEKLPKHKDIKKDSFFGTPARFNSKLAKDTCNVIYTM